MKQNKLTAVLLVVPLVIGFWTCVTAEEKAEVVHTSSSGAVLLERAGEDLWVVSTKDSARKTANGTNSR